ncbi:prepilin peptidase [Legionella sp. CNM-4043-24]|uniref:prepilin peptidase n=1 Tax=Legionella sp. CNM-4043-24 TaxID=3421646 RepID=UPI00403AD332
MIDPLIFEMNSGLFYVAVAILSLAVGSLLNVVIYRLPIMLHAEMAQECHSLLNLGEASTSKVNLFFPRSFCPSCKNTLKVWHNIPILSYLLLRGRCQYCRHPVSLRYPLIEALTCALSVFACWHFGFHLTLVFALLFIWLIIPLIFIDIDQQLLPDCLTLSLLWLGLIANTQSLFTSLPNGVLSAAGAWLSLWLLIKLFYLLTGKIGMGNGDFKLFAAFGAWFGWTLLPLILLFSSLTGAIFGLIYLKAQNKSKDTPMPFGPFLCLAGLVSLFYGPQILHWYLGRLA